MESVHGIAMRCCRLQALALLPLAALALACGAAPEPALGPAADPPRRVFLITVDTLRADHLGWHGYPRDTSPRLDEWVERGVVFERAIVQWPKTGPSFASMFTSLYPHTTGLIHDAAQTIPESYVALPGWFQERGFTTAAVISNPVLSRELGWGRGFDRYEQTWVDQATLDAVDELPVEQRPMAFRRHVWADRVNELAAPLLASLASEERLFVWLHYTDPHVPYLLQPGTGNPFLDDEHYVGDEIVDLTGAEGRALGDQRELRYYVAQYDANVWVTDRAIGAILDQIGELGMEDGSLFVLTADHGEELNIQDGEWQLVLRPPNRDREKPTIELYHLPSDPLQLRDVASEFPEVSDRLGRRLSRWIRDSPQNVTPHTEAARKALEAMGYLE